jgi:hypothetical protein
MAQFVRRKHVWFDYAKMSSVDELNNTMLLDRINKRRLHDFD